VHIQGLPCSVLLALAGVLSAAPVQALEEVARRIADAGPALSTLWPGFWPEDQAFLLYHRNGECVLASALAPDRDFSPHPADPRLWRGRCEGPRFRPDFLLQQRFGGIEAPAVRVGRRWAPAVVEPLAHEAFHAWQAANFRRTAGLELRFDLPPRRDLVMLKLHETALLIGALSAADAESRAHQVRLALALRAHRLAQMGQAAGAVEDHFMRIEGSAEWIGIGARRALEPGIHLPAELRARWRMPERATGATWEWLLRWQSYHSGAAALALLEAEAAEWRLPLAEGLAPWALLARCYGSPSMDAEAALAEAARLNRWAGVPQAASRLVRLDRQAAKALRRFQRHAGPRLELFGRIQGFEIAFTARDIHSVAEGVIVGDANPLVVESDWLRLDARRQPLLVSDSEGRMLLLLSRALDTRGCGVDLCPAGSVIKGRGIEIRLLRDARIRRQADVVSLEAVRPEP
jgi:hypothetical protein